MPFFLAYRCLNCGCIHGWIEHHLVTPVVKHNRGANEDVWWCPRCDRQHRTFDGSWFGQTEKRWEQVNSVEEAERQPRSSMDIFGYSSFEFPPPHPRRPK